jgi:N-acetylmuramoyl-L-alanine amidase
VTERVAAVVKPVATKKYYKVRPGDTLSEIASKNKTTISSICKLNGIRETTTLQIGKSLRVK